MLGVEVHISRISGTNGALSWSESVYVAKVS